MKTMKALPVLLVSLLAASAFAQTATTTVTTPGAAPAVQQEVARDVKQQERIEQGLKSGELTTKEAAKLEREEKAIDNTEARALKDGKLSPRERRQIARMQDKASRDIAAEKHNARVGNPDSKSSRRMQADVQRNINQQQRIEAGVQSGALTKKEAGSLEHGQARVAGAEAAAGADGRIGPREERSIQHKENRQSKRIFRQKHDAQTAG
jgi:hypothetical protein